MVEIYTTQLKDNWALMASISQIFPLFCSLSNCRRLVEKYHQILRNVTSVVVIVDSCNR